MKRGFSLIEIMAGITIFSLLGGMLFQTITQIAKTVKTVSQVSSFDMRFAVTSNLLEKDLAGAFMPTVVPIEDEKEKEPEKKVASPQKEQQQKEAPEKNKQKMIQVPKGFFSQDDGNGNLTMLTFITSNPVTVYNTAKARPVRVIYKLIPSPDKPSMFMLQRQESPAYMDMKVFEDKKAVRSVTVCNAVRKIYVKYFAVEIVQPQEQKKTPLEKGASQKPGEKEEPKKKQREIIEKKQWNSDELQKKPEEKQQDLEKNKEEEEQPKLPLIPECAKVVLTLAIDDDEAHDREMSFTFITTGGIVPVILEGIKPIKEEEPKKDKEDKFGHLFEKKKLSESLHDKLGDWKEDAGKDGKPISRGRP